MIFKLNIKPTLFSRHALNVLKDDLIVKLDQFSNEMLILREEIRSLQTVKAALQLRISELEEESKKTKEELATKTKKIEEEDVNISYKNHINRFSDNHLLVIIR